MMTIVAMMPTMIAEAMALLVIVGTMSPQTITNTMALAVIVMIRMPLHTLAFLFSIKHLMAVSHSPFPLMLTCLICPLKIRDSRNTPTPSLSSCVDTVLSSCA